MMIFLLRHSYDDIEFFEHLHNIIIMVFEIEYDSLFVFKKGTYDDIQYDLVYLLNLDYYENVDDLGENH